MGTQLGRLAAGAVFVAATFIGGCGTSNDDAARETALRFFDAMSTGNVAECDDTTADYLQLCEGRSTQHPAFKDGEVTSVHTDDEVLGAPAPPFGTVEATVLGGDVRLRLEKPDKADWQIQDISTRFSGRYASENLHRPEPR